MLTAKNSGGNRVAVFSDEMAMEIDFRNDIELHLQSVIESGALVLHYLPEIDMRTGEVLAAEALVRWQHPTRGLLSPTPFIGVAESINLAGELGRWVLRNACAEFARWRANGVGRNIVLRINVSPVQLVTDGFVASVAGVMKEFRLPRGSVCLEITESIVVQDIETTRSTLDRIAQGGRAGGHRRLRHRLQRAVTVEIAPGGHPQDRPQLCRRTRIRPGRPADRARGDRPGRRLRPTAGEPKGVETERAALTLLRHGCYRAAGLSLSKPILGHEMAALLAKGRVPVHFSAAPRT